MRKIWAHIKTFRWKNYVTIPLSAGEPADATACVLPFFHIYGLTVGAFTHLTTGAKLVTIPRFEPEMYLKALIQHKVSQNSNP